MVQWLKLRPSTAEFTDLILGNQDPTCLTAKTKEQNKITGLKKKKRLALNKTKDGRQGMHD